jgi:hypothetical protein
MHKRILLFTVLMMTLAVLCTLFGDNASDAPFTYDEADYMYAGTQGFTANYLDRNAMPLGAYVRNGLALAHDKTLSRKMSEDVRASGDVSFYRHYHGPLYAFWIALWHGLGVHSNAGYRATGLIVHALGAIAIFWLFPLAFPDLSEVAALIAALMFAMNRTALLTATLITQHLAYAFLSCLALFAVALYLRLREMRYWYAAAALLASCFATVEISLVLIGGAALTVAVLDWSDGWKKLLALMGKGAACFLGVLAIVWPPGVFQLTALKGYVYLAYMAIVRKTFTPISPRQLWVQKLKSYPLEYILPLAAAIAAWIYWRRLTNRRAVTPFLLYGCLLFAATLVITIPNDYYLCSLMMSLAVVTGVVFGELWMRRGMGVRAVSLVVVLGSLVALDVSYYRETVRKQSGPPGLAAETLKYLDAHPLAGRQLVAPSMLLPTLHYYHPENPIVSYDLGGTLAPLSEASASFLGAEVFCPQSDCPQIIALWQSGRVLAKEQVEGVGQDGQLWYAVTIGSR